MFTQRDGNIPLFLYGYLRVCTDMYGVTVLTELSFYPS